MCGCRISVIMITRPIDSSHALCIYIAVVLAVSISFNMPKRKQAGVYSRIGSVVLLIITVLFLRGICKAQDIISGTHRIPVLCYHQVRGWKPGDAKRDIIYIMPTDTFGAQMKALHDSGYEAILPDELTAYLIQGRRLPKKAFLLTFDDGTEGQYTEAIPQLERFGFKAVFFVMTITIGKHGYLSATQITELSKNGHIIGCHTWDHKDVRRYSSDDWQMEIERPVSELHKLTGSGISYFAYPYGVWNNESVRIIRKYPFAAAFQLRGKSSPEGKLYTIQRILVDSRWSAQRLLHEMRLETDKEY